MPLAFLQRFLHREIQAVLLILSRSERFTITVFSIIFLPGVLLHELSHYCVALLLGIKAAHFSLVPQMLPDGRLQLGYVETVKTDIVRDSLVGRRAVQLLAEASWPLSQLSPCNFNRCGLS